MAIESLAGLSKKQVTSLHTANDVLGAFVHAVSGGLTH